MNRGPGNSNKCSSLVSPSLFLSTFSLFCAVSGSTQSVWFTLSNSHTGAAKKLLVYLRDGVSTFYLPFTLSLLLRPHPLFSLFLRFCPIFIHTLVPPFLFVSSVTHPPPLPLATLPLVFFFFILKSVCDQRRSLRFVFLASLHSRVPVSSCTAVLQMQEDYRDYSDDRHQIIALWEPHCLEGNLLTGGCGQPGCVR